VIYDPPEGDSLAFNFTGEPYTAPDGDLLGFNFFIRPPYVPPAGHSVALTFSATLYIPPAGASVALEFAPSDEPVGDSQYLFPVTLDASASGDPVIWNYLSPARPEGIAGEVFGSADLRLHTRYLNLSGRGIATPGLGRPTIINWFKTAFPSGFVATAYGRPTLYNLRQYITGRSFDSSSYGAAFLMGGVKIVAPGGNAAAGYGRPTLINTTADQTANPPGIPAPGMGALSVSPRMLRPLGSGTWAFGTPWLQRNPSPLGFDSMALGRPAIEYWTKQLHVGGVAAPDLGFPRVFDPTIRVFPSSALLAGVFGDVAIINKSRFIRVLGDDYFTPSDWAAVESNRRNLAPQGWGSSRYGLTEIANKSPSIAPDGMAPVGFGGIGVGYSIRHVEPPGMNLAGYGRPSLTKTPAIEPKGIAGSIGVPTIWFRVRGLDFHGYSAQLFGGAQVWFARRRVQFDGFDAGRYGTAKLEHSRRFLSLLGLRYDRYGTARVTNADRTISPDGIFEDFAHSHMVGGDRWLRPLGFDAARFGARVIPEIQQLYPRGFTGVYGWPTVFNQTQQVRPSGMTTGHEPADRWGTAKVFNSWQYVSMSYDPDSQLNPPAWPQWTKIENRNKVMGVTGTLMERVPAPYIFNNARPLFPRPMEAPSQPSYYQAGMVSHRIRSFTLEGIEAPYISTWSRVYNDAFVIRPAGFSAHLTGQAALENTRRYFNRIGALDAAVFGLPMVADRVRMLAFEGRYTIGSPVIQLPEVKLYTRYVDAIGSDMSRLGLSSLSIHWRIITPRWTHRDFFGFADLRNLTPEVRTQGRAADEYGAPLIRLEWRPVNPDGSNMQLFGRAGIADRDRKVFVSGLNAGAIGDKLRVIKMGAPPYSEQNISLLDDFGIEAPQGQVPRPGFNQYVLYTFGFESERYGAPAVRINGATIEAGIRDDDYGVPFIGLKNRVVTVDPWNGPIYQPSPARITPHTIWAVKEAPQQAKDNHPARTLHYVGEVLGANGYPPGERFGTTRISTYLGRVNPTSLGMVTAYGRPRLQLRTSYIQVSGLQAYRVGWTLVSDGNQEIAQFAAADTQVFGRPAVARAPYVGPLTIGGRGLASLAIGSHRIEFFHRQLWPQGHDSQRLGTRRAGDSPYMWQGLRVGPLMPTIPTGTQMGVYGEPWVSFRVRELALEGFDAFRCEYEPEAFDKRMRVTRGVIERPYRTIAPAGVHATEFAASDVKPGVHFIRPDGNADQYRKGAF